MAGLRTAILVHTEQEPYLNRESKIIHPVGLHQAWNRGVLFPDMRHDALVLLKQKPLVEAFNVK